MTLLKTSGFCICSKPTKKMEGRRRWLKTCGDRKCSHALHVITMTTKDEDGLSKADLRSKKLVRTQLDKDPDAFKKIGLKAVQTIGEEGIKKRNDKISKALRLTDDRTGLKRFRRSVVYHTKKQDLSDLENFSRLSQGFEIDHVLSVVDGFKAGLTPKQVAHKANLRIVSKAENRAKWMRSDMTAQQLLEKIK